MATTANTEPARITPPPLPKPSATPPPLPKRSVTPPPLRLRFSVLTPEDLEAYKDLLVFARTTVEGYFTGRHRSPYRGAAGEFLEFKEYSPGDDATDIDWRVYGRSRRLYLRQQEQHTDMILYLLVDTSASMAYAGQGRSPKLHIAAKLAASLAYLMHRQGDKASLALFSDRVHRLIPPGGTRRHLHRLVSTLETVTGSSTTGIAAALAHCDGVFLKRGQLIVLSDFHTDHDAMFSELSRFQHRGFGILLLQILDPDEIDLPPHRVAEFVDMETGETLQVDPAEIRISYRERVKKTQNALARQAISRHVEFQTFTTSEPYTRALEGYLGFRRQRRRT